MAETVDRGYEVVLGFSSSIAHNELVEYGVVGIGEEYRLDVCIVDADMLHSVFLLVAAGQFVFLNISLLVVVSMGADHESILGFTVHRLGIYIIMFARVLYQPAIVLELLEVLGGFLVDAWVVLRGAFGEVDLWLDDMIQTLGVVASLSTCLV